MLSPKTTEVFDTYWHFAAERQRIFFKRLAGKPAPWTDDPILRQYKFTNAYRASDRVSQYLIKNVIYQGNPDINEVFFRIMLFKFLNRIETWELLVEKLGRIEYATFSFETYDKVLNEALESGKSIFSAAYIMPPGGKNSAYSRKHQNYLRLLERMMGDEVPKRLTEARSMREAFEVLRKYRMIGDFLAYQYVTDINYSNVTDFSEMEFVMPGPGAIDGIHKCFNDLGEYSEKEVIRLVAENQEQEFARRGLDFQTLWGRRLQLIDCQNLFCEVGKYARIAHPNVRGTSKRMRIKQAYKPLSKKFELWYPPKWGINHLLRTNP